MLTNAETPDPDRIVETSLRNAPRFRDGSMIGEPAAQFTNMRVLFSRHQADDAIDVEGVVAAKLLVTVVEPVPERREFHQQVRKCLRHTDPVA